MDWEEAVRTLVVRRQGDGKEAETAVVIGAKDGRSAGRGLRGIFIFGSHPAGPD